MCHYSSSFKRRLCFLERRCFERARIPPIVRETPRIEPNIILAYTGVLKGSCSGFGDVVDVDVRSRSWLPLVSDDVLSDDTLFEERLKVPISGTVVFEIEAVVILGLVVIFALIVKDKALSVRFSFVTDLVSGVNLVGFDVLRFSDAEIVESLDVELSKIRRRTKLRFDTNKSCE